MTDLDHRGKILSLFLTSFATYYFKKKKTQSQLLVRILFNGAWRNGAGNVQNFQPEPDADWQETRDRKEGRRRRWRWIFFFEVRMKTRCYLLYSAPQEKKISEGFNQHFLLLQMNPLKNNLEKKKGPWYSNDWKQATWNQNKWMCAHDYFFPSILLLTYN